MKELTELEISEAAITALLEVTVCSDLAQLSDLLGADSEAVVELKRLFELAEGYGFAGWLQFDASVVRGLAYYTGAARFTTLDR